MKMVQTLNLKMVSPSDRVGNLYRLNNVSPMYAPEKCFAIKIILIKCQILKCNIVVQDILVLMYWI